MNAGTLSLLEQVLDSVSMEIGPEWKKQTGRKEKLRSFLPRIRKRKLSEMSLVDLRFFGFSNLGMALLFFLGAIFVSGNELGAVLYLIAGICSSYTSAQHFDMYQRKNWLDSFANTRNETEAKNLSEHPTKLTQPIFPIYSYPPPLISTHA